MGYYETLKAKLTPGGDADPRSRTDQFTYSITADRGKRRPDRPTIEDAIVEYDENPLIHQPVDMWAADVVEPGARADVEFDSDDVDAVEVREDHPEYSGLTVTEALDRWLGECGIIAGEFGRGFTDTVENLLRDVKGRRGTGLAELVYDDAAEKNRLLGFRPFRAETVTAYTRPGTGILLRPNDDADLFDPENPLRGRSLDGSSRASAPRTPAGETAAYVQFDDIFGTREASEVPFAQSDVVKLVNAVNTGDVFGQPDTAQVLDRAKGLRNQLADLDAGIQAKTYGYWIVKVGSESERVPKSEAQDLVEDLNVDDPTSKTAVPYQVDPQKFDGEVPQVDPLIQKEIEYILSAMPVPRYKAGFAGNINRDISTEQNDGYQKTLSKWRTRVESAFNGAIQQKAAELAPADVDVTARLKLEPERDANPLKDDAFDASEFASVMSGVADVAPGGMAAEVLPPETVVETFLGLDADEVLGEDDPEADAPLDEADPEVQAAFEATYAPAEADD